VLYKLLTLYFLLTLHSYKSNQIQKVIQVQL